MIFKREDGYCSELEGIYGMSLKCDNLRGGGINSNIIILVFYRFLNVENYI